MRMLRRAILCLACLLPSTPLGAAAQERSGVGAIVDFIYKLSGPQFLGAGLTGYWRPSDTPLQARLSAIRRSSIREEGEVVPDDANITMTTLQLGLEYLVPRVPVNFAGAVAYHRFGGDADAFWHPSFPFEVAARIPPIGGRVVIRPAIGYHIFTAFDDSDFEPLVVSVSRDETEYVRYFSLTIEVIGF
jgi:hypothetical protein